MQQEQLPRIKAMLFEAMQLAPSLREAFLKNYPGADGEHIELALSLLAAQSTFPEILADPAPFIGHIAEPLFASGELISERYRIQHLLHYTASSQAYLAIDERLADGHVVVKFPLQDASRFGALENQLWAEINSLARLRHPSVSGLIDTGFHRGHPYLVTQFVEGPNLDDWIELHHPHGEARFQLFLHLLSVVEVIHRHKLLHLDLKPSNIIVHHRPSQLPALTILDFGTAKLSDASNHDASGTPLYAAPERATGQASYSSDLYSLARIGQKILTEAPPAVKAVLALALSEDPTLRPLSVIVFHSLLQDAWTRSQRRKRLGFRLAIVALCVFAAASLWWALAPSPVASLPPLQEITSLRGAEIDPTLSPDGEMVYFSHASPLSASSSIYSIPFNGGLASLRFAAPPGVDYLRPAISPDGAWIAFVSEVREKEGSIQVASLDGKSRRNVYTGQPESLSFGINGDVLYFTDHDPRARGYVLKSVHLKTGEVNQLAVPPSGYHGDRDVSISPDGRYAVFVRYRTLECADVYLLPVRNDGSPAAIPMKLTSLDRRLHRPHWFPDGKSIIFVGGTLTQLTAYKAKLNLDANFTSSTSATVTPLSAWGSSLRFPSIALHRNRVVFSRDREDEDIYRLKLNGDARLERYISSTQLDEEPRYAPDGKHIAFFSERSLSLQGWLAPSSSPGAARTVTSYDRAEKAWPSWSPSGEAYFFARLPFIGPEILKVNPFSPATQPQRVFSADRMQHVACLSAASDAVFVEVREGKTVFAEKWSLLSEARERIAETSFRFCREFFREGNSTETLLFFSGQSAANGLFLLEKSGPRRIYPSIHTRNTFAYRNGFVYLASKHPQPGIYKVELNSGKSELLTPLDKNPGWGMDVSPDGKELLIALYDFEDANIVGAELPQP